MNILKPQHQRGYWILVISYASLGSWTRFNPTPPPPASSLDTSGRDSNELGKGIQAQWIVLELHIDYKLSLFPLVFRVRSKIKRELKNGRANAQ